MRTPLALLQRTRVDTVDQPLLWSLIGLGLYGVVVIYSATKPSLVIAHDNPYYYLERQLVWVLAGMVVMVLISRIDYRKFELVTTLGYVGALAALLGVFVIGSSELGADRWYVFGPIQIQPSEFALLAVILAMATYCGRRPDGLTMYDVRRMLLMSALPFVLILAQPDLGTAIIMTMTLGVMLFVAGVPPRFLALLITAGIAGAVGSVYFGLLHKYQINRLLSFLHQDSSAKKYQQFVENVANAKSAIGAGGWFGAGLFKGALTVTGYVPEQRTDFIFTAIGEQLGLVGTVFTVLFLGFVGWRLYVIARDAKEPMGRLLAVGIFMFFGFSCFENIGMTLGIMPVAGIPLPLISYGGSSALVFYLCGGAALAVSRRRTN